MLDISKALGSSTVKNYYRAEYSAASSGYYTEGRALVGTWHGKLATDFGLTGGVAEEAFDRLALGQHPLTAEVLVGRTKPKAPPEPAWVKQDEAWRDYIEQAYITAMSTGGRSIFEAAAPYKRRLVKTSAPAASKPEEPGEREQKLLEMHKIATALYCDNLAVDAGARRYLEARNVSGDLAAEFMVGVAGKADRQLAERLQAFGPELMKASGLFRETPRGELVDRFRGRLMFPIQDASGSVIGFAGRRLNSDERTPKYVNSPATELYRKGEVLFNVHRARDAAAKKGKVVVVEGYMDAIAAHRAGVPVVATCGTAMTPEQAKKLHLMASTTVLNMDSDEAGQRAAQGQMKTLLEAGVNPLVVALPAKDPAEFIAESGAKAYRREVQQAQGAVAWLVAQAAATHDIGDSQGKVVAIRSVMDVLAVVPAERRREVAGELATFLGTEAPPIPDRMEHRSGWDLTFNCPKTISLTALVGGDERVKAAHQGAVRVALDETERYVQARMGGFNPAETTGKWVAATFEHDTARPVGGYPAPHLHTHAVVFNMTEAANGRVRALQPSELFRIQSMATAVYQNQLEYSVRALGYKIQRGSNHAPDIAGYSPEYLASESLRSATLKTEKEERGVSGREAESIIQHQNREEKLKLTPQELRALHRANAGKFGNQPAAIVAAAGERQARAIAPETARERAGKAVTFARNRLSERDAVFEHFAVVRDALRHTRGKAQLADISRELEREKREGQFIAVEHVRPSAPLCRYTTPELIGIERETIQMVLAGQNQMHRTAEVSERAIRARYGTLNDDQRRLVYSALATTDQIFGIEGNAGTGKTTALSAIRELAEESGYRTRGLGPTSRAARGLKEAGISSETLQAYLTRGYEPADDARPRLFFVDESSLASGRQMRDFLLTLGPLDRVLLSGNKRQHESIEAGRIFAQLQEAGMKVASLTKIVRQKDEGLREVVKAMATGQPARGVELLGEQGRIHSVEHRKKRFEAIAVEYSSMAGKGTVAVVTPDNLSRQEISSAIRTELQRAGKLHADIYTSHVLISRQELTSEDKGVAGSYKVGDCVRYLRGSAVHGLEAKSYATVIASDGEANQITVKREDGKQVTYDPARLKGVSVYRPEAKAFAVGDRVIFTAPFKDRAVSTRDMGTVRYLDPAGNIRVELDDNGRTVGWNLKNNRHVDHGYAGTSHALQGATLDYGIVHVDTGDTRVKKLVNDTLGYVAVSRFRYDVKVFTDSERNLGSALLRHVENTTALSPAETVSIGVGD